MANIANRTYGYTTVTPYQGVRPNPMALSPNPLNPAQRNVGYGLPAPYTQVSTGPVGKPGSTFVQQNQQQQTTTVRPPWDASFVGDYSSDPLLVEGGATLLRNRGELDAHLKEQQRRRLIALGSKAVAQRVLGADDQSLAGITDDPSGTSALSELARLFNRGVVNTNEDFNKQNLWYGGHRGLALSQMAEDRLQQENNLISAAEGDLSGYLNEWQTGINNLAANQRELERQAAERAWQNAYGKWWSGGFDQTTGGGPQMPDATYNTPAEPWVPGPVGNYGTIATASPGVYRTRGTNVYMT